MSAAERRKGARGQLEVRRLFEAHGWQVTATASSRRRASSGTPDLIATRAGITLAVEVKNCKTLRLPAWRRQTLANAPEGTVPVLVYRYGRLWVAAWYEAGEWCELLADYFSRARLTLVAT